MFSRKEFDLIKGTFTLPKLVLHLGDHGIRGEQLIPFSNVTLHSKNSFISILTLYTPHNSDSDKVLYNLYHDFLKVIAKCEKPPCYVSYEGILEIVKIYRGGIIALRRGEGGGLFYLNHDFFIPYPGKNYLEIKDDVQNVYNLWEIFIPELGQDVITVKPTNVCQPFTR